MFFKRSLHSFYFLNATQFLGALNDNLFKLLVVYLLIHLKGPQAASAILSLAGAIFVIPFLLFSSGAGVLADRISKRKIIVYTKVLEVFVMVFGLISVAKQWEFGCFTALFIMAGQSALFGPSKYGIIPELVEESFISKANGHMTSFTYLAIIAGTLLASLLTDITNKNFVLVACVCVFFAVIGLITSLKIQKTAPQNNPKKINPFFLYEVYQTLKFSWTIPHLLPCIFGAAFFLFMGSFVQLNIIPFGMQSLGLSEVGGGYLFLSTAIGIAIGAVLSGYISKDRVEPGLSCIAALFIAILLYCLHAFANSLTFVTVILGLLGIFGGAYLIPFESFLQAESPNEKRGQIIATANFFGFVGVLLASIFLYFISNVLDLSASCGFAWMASLMFLGNLILIGRISSFLFSFIVRKIIVPFRSLKLITPIPPITSIIVLESNSWFDALLLFSYIPKLRILIPEKRFKHFPWFNGLLESIRIISLTPDVQYTKKLLADEIQRAKGEPPPLCLFLHKRKDNTKTIASYKKMFDHLNVDIFYAHGIKQKFQRKFLFFKFHKRRITLSFAKQ